MVKANKTKKPPDALSALMPPFSLEAEQSVLGAILLRPAVLDEVADLVQPEDFYREAHSRIYRAMLGLYARNEPVDWVSVSARLEEVGWLEEVGGRVFLSSLSEQVGTAANAPHYATLVRNKAVLRRLMDCSQEIAAACSGTIEEPEEFLGWVEEKIFALTQINPRRGGPRLVREYLDPVFLKLEDLHEKKTTLTGLSSGLYDLDRLTGGFQESDLFIIAGRPGQGKTGLALNICGNLAAQKVPSLFFSLEMGAEQLVKRLLASQGRLNTLHLRDGTLTPGEWATLYRLRDQIEEAPIFIDEAVALTALEIRSRTRQLVKKEKVRLVVIDYLTKVRPTKGRTRNEEIGYCVQAFKDLARELRLPVLVLSQLSRDTERREDKRPMLRDLRDSGEIEQEADIVAFLYRDEYYFPEETDKKGITELIFRKHRNGPLGTVELAFDAASVTFRNLAKTGGGGHGN